MFAACLAAGCQEGGRADFEPLPDADGDTDAGADPGKDGMDGDASTDRDADGTDATDGGIDGTDETSIPPDPAEAGDQPWSQTSAEVHVDDGGSGVDIPLDIYLPDGAGPFPLVVFLHGFQLSPDLYASYGGHLASWGYAVIFPAMPGSLIGGPNHRELKEYLLAILDWIDTNAPDAQGPLGGRVNSSLLGLAGHSMGGKIVLLTASEDDRALGVFGLDPVDTPGVT